MGVFDGVEVVELAGLVADAGELASLRGAGSEQHAGG
jgi:hypothetical protein